MDFNSQFMNKIYTLYLKYMFIKTYLTNRKILYIFIELLDIY